MRPTIGLPSSAISRNSSASACRPWCSSSTDCSPANPLRSAPAQNARSPAPVRTTTATSASPLHHAKALRRSPIIDADSGFRCSGRFMVTVATEPSISSRTSPRRGRSLMVQPPDVEKGTGWSPVPRRSSVRFWSLRGVHPVEAERLLIHAWELGVVDVVRDPVVEPAPPQVVTRGHAPAAELGGDALAVVHHVDVAVLGAERLRQLALATLGPRTARFRAPGGRPVEHR